MKKTIFYLILVVLLLQSALNGCAPAGAPTAPIPSQEKDRQTTSPSKWEQVVAAAKKEEKIVVYAEVVGKFKERFVQDFKNRYGIEVQFVTGRAAELATRYLNERAANIQLADVLMLGMSTTLGHLKPRGVLAPTKSHLMLPEVLDGKVWQRGALPFLDKDELALSLVAGFSSYLVSNTEMVKPGDIGSYQDLLSSRWKGKITLNDPTVPGSGSMWVAFVLLRIMGKEKGEAYLRQTFYPLSREIFGLQ